MGLNGRTRRWLQRTSRPLWRLVVAGDSVAAVSGAPRFTWRSSVTSVDTPDLVDVPMPRFSRHLARSSYAPPPAEVAVLKRVRFQARFHVVFTARRRLLVDSVSTGDLRDLVGWRQLLGAAPVDLPGLTSTFRSFQNTYYHTLIDNLPRLFLLDEARRQFGIEPELLVAGPLTPAEAFLVPRLAPGLRVREVDPRHVYRAERFLFLGFLTRRFSGWLPPEYLAWLRRRIAPGRPPRRDRRIWISRQVIAGRHMRNVTNEAAVMDALAPLGFEAYRLEDLTIPQQVELFYDAEMVVAPHGAGLANLIFGSGARVLELFPSRFVVPHYHLLAAACGHTHTWWCGDGRHRDSDLVADIPEIVGRVERWVDRQAR